jgi:Coenzyme PQQ synthesis protein D (PqqD)
MTARTIPDSAIVVAAGEFLDSEFGTELVILNLKDGVYYGLEDVGARIWKLVQEPVTIAAIREVLVSEFDVEAARCERDIRKLLGELAARGLLQIREQP